MKNVKLPKREVEYRNDDLIIDSYNYDLQYSSYYSLRLNQMKPKLLSSAKYQWPGIPIYKLNELADTEIELDKISQDSQDDPMNQTNPFFGKDVIVIGTLLKKMPKQPNILKEISDDRKFVDSNDNNNLIVNDSNFMSPDDTLFLQDYDAIIELKGDIKVEQLCTGICAAVKGQVNPNGSGFVVEDICFVSLESENSNKKAKIEKPLEVNDYYVLLVSGLSFCNDLTKNQKLTSSLNLLYDLIAGNSEMILDKTIVNVIIAGNSISPKTREEQKANSNERWNQKNMPNSYEAVKLFDKFLANVGQYMFVDIMPGHNDLCTLLWPQQPLHPCMFPKAFRLTTIKSVTNPHRAKYFGVDFLGTSGENVDSVRSCTSWNESIEIMRNILQWGHISPTCPDLLHSYPFSKTDPLTIDNDYPDVFFAGNQPDFSIGTFSTLDGKKSIRLISIPSFEEKFIGVMVNLRTLDCEMLAFN